MPRRMKLRAVLILGTLAAASIGLHGQERSMAQDPSLNNLVHPEGYETAPLGTFGHVEKQGTGPVPMVLIPGGGFGWSVFEPFMKNQENEYTMYAVSLAGMGGTKAPPMPPEGTSYGEQTWIRGGVRALIDLIEREKLDRPVVGGHFLEGSQIGLRIAIDHPELVRGVILFAGTAVITLPNMSPSLEERIRYQDERMAPNWFKTVTLETWNDNNFPPRSYSLDPERGARLFEQVSHGPLPVYIRYLLEFWASDVSLEFGDIATPVLVLTPGFPEDMLEEEATKWLRYYFLDTWKGVEKIALVERSTIEDAAIFVWLDQPELVGKEVARFVGSVAKR
ncbi:MAG TPA: alpha/beta hydrolase [Vicinamibacteria bacterium]|nr:alpha/beta hydrolase [Vicinamibacteria bacterium]